MKVLLVDDSELWRTALESFLTPAGFDVLLARDGVEGVAAACKHLPDVILMDGQMPRMDGWEAVQALRATRRTAKIPVILSSSADVCPDRARSAGFFCSLPKHVSADRMIETLHSCAAASR